MSSLRGISGLKDISSLTHLSTMKPLDIKGSVHLDLSKFIKAENLRNWIEHIFRTRSLVAADHLLLPTQTIGLNANTSHTHWLSIFFQQILFPHFGLSDPSLAQLFTRRCSRGCWLKAKLEPSASSSASPRSSSCSSRGRSRAGCSCPSSSSSGLPPCRRR